MHRRAGESAQACAERELSEEAGLGARRWDHLGGIVTIPSFATSVSSFTWRAGWMPRLASLTMTK